MVEIDKAAEARRKAQRNGEEDPVIIAQRFLNIYRQIHIFTPERKAAFDKMLLELPAEIRGLFGSLPGGALLQDYVDELAEKSGLEKSAASVTATVDDDEVSRAKILATALAEAQAQAAAKMQTAAPFAAGSAANATVAVPSKIALDKDFAATFAATLADAMQKNNAAQKDDIRNIIQSLGQTQLQIVKVLQNESAQQRQEMQNIYKAISESEVKIADAGNQAPAAAPAANEETMNLMKVLVDGQQQLALRLGKIEADAFNPPVQTAPAAAAPMFGEDGIKQLSHAILNSQENFSKTIAILSERQKNDALEIAKLINESQQQMMNFMVQHNTLNQNQNSGNAAASNNNANNIQINTTDYTQQLNQIVDRLANLQINVQIPENAFAVTPAVVPSSATVVGTPVSTTVPEATANFNFDSAKIGKMLQDTMVTQSKLYREMAKSQTEELSSVISAALRESQKISTQNLIEALKAHPIVVQPPANSYDTHPAPSSHRPSGEAKPEDALDIAEITPPRVERTNDSLPRLQPEFVKPEDSYTAAAENFAEPKQEDKSIPLIELSDYETAQTVSDTNDNADISLIPDNNPEAAPKKKKKKKKKKKNSADTALSEVLSASIPGIESKIFSGSDMAESPSLEDESFISYGDKPIRQDIPTANAFSSEDDETTDTRPADLMTNSAPPMPDIPADEELWPDDDFGGKERFDTEDEDFGTNWLGNVEEEAPSWETEFLSPVSENDISPDDWGFNSESDKNISALEENTFNEHAPDSSDGEPADGEGEEWVWEYVEEAEAANTNYGNDNLEPILQQSAVCSGDLYYQNPSFDGVSISAGAPAHQAVYKLNITDSADGEIDDDPYQKGVIKD